MTIGQWETHPDNLVFCNFSLLSILLLWNFIFSHSSSKEKRCLNVHFIFIFIANYYLCRYLHPITFGNYPETMRFLVGNRLPTFSASQSEMLKGSFDFLGVTYYTARYADDSTSYSSVNLSYTTDSHVNLTSKLRMHTIYLLSIIRFPLTLTYTILLPQRKKMAFLLVNL